MNTLIDNFFHTSDPILSRLYDTYGRELTLPTSYELDNVMQDLCQTIVSQQLSVKAAATIWGRVKLLADDWNNPEKVLCIDNDRLRSAGLSGQKTSYIKNIATGILDGTLHPHAYATMPDADIIKELVTIKGIGVWTAEMFLIFTLGREDVFSIGDLGLRNAITKHYEVTSQDDMLSLSAQWSPYRSYASMILWSSLDNKPKD